MTDISKLKAEAEEAKRIVDEKFYQEFDTRIHSLSGLSAIADAIIAATIAQIALQAAEKEAEAHKFEKPCFECARSHPHENMNYECLRKTVEAQLANTKAHPAPIADDGWIKWEGGECPIENDVKFDWRGRDGIGMYGCYGAKEMRWTHGDSCSDIIAYRIVVNAADRVEE